MIKTIQFPKQKVDTYPLNIPSIKNTSELVIDPKITIFVGDNGSGKSTLLKAIAANANAIYVAGNKRANYSQVKDLAENIKIAYQYRSNKGMFFSGEDFITYIQHLKTMKEGFLKDIEEINKEFAGKSDYSRSLALGPVKKELYALENQYGKELTHRSHGEGFLYFFKARMHQKGLYLLDEPETPLSPINQYQLLVLLSDLAKDGSQIIIATHSPILMALKGAVIYQFTSDGIDQVKYEDIESVTFLKHFVNDPENFTNRI
jgi:predicted ATPase